jgi:hypothetical protein
VTKLTFSWAQTLCVLPTYVSICRTLGHENHGAKWFWQPLHLTSKAKDMWPLVHFTFKSVIVSNMPILKYIIFSFREPLYVSWPQKEFSHMISFFKVQMALKQPYPCQISLFTGGQEGYPR